MKKIKKEKIKRINDIGKRAFKTFFQAFIGAIVITLPSSDLSSKDVIKSIIIGAIASGLSALMNFINNLIEEMN